MIDHGLVTLVDHVAFIFYSSAWFDGPLEPKVDHFTCYILHLTKRLAYLPLGYVWRGLFIDI